MVENFEKQQLLISVARLYYEQDESQEQIAQKLHLSRPYVSKLLKAARKEGLVQIKVVDPIDQVSPFEAEFCQRFHLDKAIILPDSISEDPLQTLGSAAARYLEEILTEKDIVATSWGDTLYQVSLALKSRKYQNGLKAKTNLTYVQLCGGFSSVRSSSYTSEIASNFSEAYDCPSYIIQLPAILGSVALKEMLMQDPQMSKVFQLGKQATVAVITAGTFGEKSALFREGFLSEEQVKELTQKGAVGDICCHVIKADGALCDEELDARTVAISLEDIRNMRCRIGVAQGDYKLRSIHAALCSGIMNVFITNHSTAVALLNQPSKNN